MKRTVFYIGILLFILSSCSKYEKLLKSSDYNLKYRKAFEYYNKKDYTRALGLFDQIVPVLRGTAKADTASFYQGMSAFRLKDYPTANYHFTTFYQTYSYSPFAEEAEYLAAHCLYMESPNPELDQESTTKGIEAFTFFIRKYPESKYTEKSREQLIELQDKLVDKSRLSAKLYYNMGMYKSSIVALKSSLEEYPNTKYREELMWYVLDSNYQLAEFSIESKKKDRYQTTIDEYYSFISEFPKSQWREKADKIYEKSQKMVK